MDYACQPAVRLVAWKSSSQVFPDGFLREVLERKLVAKGMSLQFAFDALERVFAQDHFNWAISANNHELGGISTPGQVRDQINSGKVAPVQVFQHEDQRMLGSERLQRVCHLAQHALTGSAQDLGLQRLPLRGRNERRHLCQPCRRILAETFDNLPSVCSSKPRESIQNRHVGFAGAVVFQALAAGDPQSRNPGGVFQ